jgi:hypothetical protein
MIGMSEKQAELMRGLTAMQAALWDVIDTNMNSVDARQMLAIIAARVTRLSMEIAGTQYIGEN